MPDELEKVEKKIMKTETALNNELMNQIPANPLLMSSACFVLWLAEKGVFLPELPESIISRAALLHTFAFEGIIDVNEIEKYFKEAGLMIPIPEN